MNDKLKGQGKQLRGDVKEAIGDLTGDRKLEMDGKLDRAEGKLQEGYGKVKEAVRDAARDADRPAGRDIDRR